MGPDEAHPSNLNPHLEEQLKGKPKKTLSTPQIIDGIRRGDRYILGRAITLVESKKADHQEAAREIIEACLPFSGKSLRIGITGTPGVGKSTFIEALGLHLNQQNKKIAVLAIDPTSQRSRGSILGDKTRMEKLAASETAFIRPSPAGETLGGVARKTRETIILCEAAGYEVIFVETVGVGQSETAVHSMVDFFLLLLMPGAGDELQGIKRGVVEMADLIAVNKADGDRLPAAKKAKQEYRNALHLYPPKESQWIPKAVLCSALEGTGIPKIWQLIQEYYQQMAANGFFDQNRSQQARFWLRETLNNRLLELFNQHPVVKTQMQVIEQAVLEGKKSPFQGAEELLRLFTG